MNISSLIIVAFSALWIVFLIIFPSDLERIILINLENILERPSHEYMLGTDDLGRDILARLISGVRLSLFVAFVVVAFTSIFGRFTQKNLIFELAPGRFNLLSPLWIGLRLIRAL